MALSKFKKDRRNYRIHDENSKKIIKKSLEECGAGRSILADSTGEIIAGNGVFEQAEKQGLKVKTVETDGSELVVVVRKDLKPGDEKRKLLALADNAASDASSWNAELVRKDWNATAIHEWGMPENIWIAETRSFESIPVQPQTTPPVQEEAFDTEGLPDELSGVEMEPAELPKIEGDFRTEYGRIIITFPWDKQNDVMRILGLTSIDKVVYSIQEILGEK